MVYYEDSDEWWEWDWRTISKEHLGEGVSKVYESKNFASTFSVLYYPPHQNFKTKIYI